MFIVKTKEK